jgi:hypothetical protein
MPGTRAGAGSFSVHDRDACIGLACGLVGSGGRVGESGLRHRRLLAASRGVEVPHPIAAGDRLEGEDCQGWRLRHRRGDATAGSALDRPALEGYTIGSG